MSNCNLGILFFSDIHLRSSKDLILLNIDAIYDRVKNKCLEVSELIIIISGDIVFSGKEEEFTTAYIFFEELREKLESYIGKKITIICSPGNHDCNFDDSDSIRDVIISSVLEKKSIDDSKIEYCCKPQKNFFEFEKSLSTTKLIETFKDKLLSINKMVLKDTNIYIVTYNTAWLSKMNEKQGELYFPISRYKEELKSCSDGIVISTFHHPAQWYHPDEANAFDYSIESLSDIILSGHEHTADIFTKERETGKVIYIKAESLQEYSDSRESKFAYMNFNARSFSLQIERYGFNSESGYYEISNSEEYKCNNLNTNKKAFKLNENYIEFLQDTGVNFKHPRKEQLFLKDIFIYPMLDELDFDKSNNKKMNVMINSKDIFTVSGVTFIYGDETSCKTSLSKMYFLDSYSSDYYPLLIDAKEVSVNNINNIEGLIKEIFQKEYNDKYDIFTQVDHNKIIVLIDDFHKMKVTKKQKDMFIKKLLNIYSNIIIFENNEMEVDEVLNNSLKQLGVNFKQYKIKKFGYKLRGDLIHRWNMIGYDDYENSNELLAKDDQASCRIDTLIGKNYIPSVPFYLLTMLQAFEMGHEHRFTDSAYGHYYQYLILQSLNTVTSEQGSVDALQNFLVYTAKYSYYEKKNYLTYDEFIDIHNQFCKEYQISRSFKEFKNFDTLMEKLFKVNLLKYENNSYKFKYKYIYYYCLGKYFGDELEENYIKDDVQHMIKNLHIEEYANIVLFIIHHTKTKYILDELLENVDIIFSENEVVKLNGDITYLKESYMNDLPNMIMKNISTEEYREEQLLSKDKIENSNDNSIEVVNVEDESTENKDISVLNQFNYSFKGMEILGQILKNYWGSLKGQRRTEIGIKLYELGLRALRETYKTLEDSEEELAHILSINLKDKKKISQIEIERYTQKMLFLFTAFFAHSCIDKIGSCIGDDKLSETFNDIELNLEYNSVKLVNLGIKLQYFGPKFPYSEVQQLLEENKNNILAKFLIANMVKNHLYMYEKTVSEKAKIAALVGIEIKDTNIQKYIEKQNN